MYTYIIELEFDYIFLQQHCGNTILLFFTRCKRTIAPLESISARVPPWAHLGFGGTQGFHCHAADTILEAPVLLRFPLWCQ